jgi:hypothetical protein
MKTLDQTLGAVRAILTALGGALAAWGFLAEPLWAPIPGIVLALISVLWGVMIHRDPNKPGKIKWSLVRKLFNATGAGLVVWGVASSDQIDSLMVLLGSLGPLIATSSSIVTNDPEK